MSNIDKPSAPSVPETVEPAPEEADEDFRQRLASIRRCVPHMVDHGGIWPRDVEWLIAELEKARAARSSSETLEALPEPTDARQKAEYASQCLRVAISLAINVEEGLNDLDLLDPYTRQNVEVILAVKRAARNAALESSSHSSASLPSSIPAPEPSDDGFDTDALRRRAAEFERIDWPGGSAGVSLIKDAADEIDQLRAALEESEYFRHGIEAGANLLLKVQRISDRHEALAKRLGIDLDDFTADDVALLRKTWHSDECGALNVLGGGDCQCTSRPDVIALDALADRIEPLLAGSSPKDSSTPAPERIKGFRDGYARALVVSTGTNPLSWDEGIAEVEREATRYAATVLSPKDSETPEATPPINPEKGVSRG